MQSDKNWSYRIFNNGDNSDYNAAMVTKIDVNGAIEKFINKIPENLDTSNLTSMSGFFQGCINLENIPNIDTSNATNFQNCFCNCTNLKQIPQIDTSKGTNLGSLFKECRSITTIPQIDTANTTSMSDLFYNCSNITDIPSLNASKVTSIYNMLSGCEKLTNFNGLIEIGKAFTSKSNNYNNYTFNLRSCTNLTHESLVNIINNLYDLNLTYDTANGGTLYKQAFQLGKNNLAKLTDAFKSLTVTFL